MLDGKVNPQMAALSLKAAALRVGLVISDCQTEENGAVAAIANPVSLSVLTALCILDQSDCAQAAIQWLIDNKVSEPEKIQLLYGQEGYKNLLSEPSLNAVYVAVGPSSQHQCVLDAVRAGKHVLVHDVKSTVYEEFMERLRLAVERRRFIQSSTMFIHNERVKVFMDCCNSRHKFGDIQTIKAKLILNYDDAVDILGVQFPPAKGDGCIRRLGRYCVLIATLLLSRAGSRPISVQVVQCELSDKNEPLSAECIVQYTDDRVLIFEVAYSGIPTRQILEVQAQQRYATMTDFVVPHPDGLATYRIYDKAPNESGKLEVVRGEAIDVMSGPPQNVMMWRRFGEFCRAVEQSGYEASEEARELANTSMLTKRVLRALDESLQQRRSIPVAEDELLTKL